MKLALLTGVICLAACRAPDPHWEPRRPPGHFAVTPVSLAGTYVGESLVLRGMTGDTMFYRAWSPDTLTFTADGSMRSALSPDRVGTSYLTRSDSLFVSGGQQPHAYAVSLTADHLVLYEWSSFDFDANGVPETAIRRLVFDRQRSRASGR